MKEGDITAKLMRFFKSHGEDPFKVPDSLAGSARMRFSAFKGADIVFAKTHPASNFVTVGWCEVKVVKAATGKGLTFKPKKQVQPRQTAFLEEKGGLIAVGFVVKRKGANDSLAAICVCPWSEVSHLDKVGMAHMVSISYYLIPGPAIAVGNEQ